MLNNERKFVEIENLNGEIEKIEIFAEIKSQRDDKTYILMTNDENIEDDVNMEIGFIYEENDKIILELVEEDDEINYVYSLINKNLMED